VIGHGICFLGGPIHVKDVAVIYLDHNATTRPDPAVRAAMEAVLDGEFGNPSSLHAAGRRARDLVERARAEVAAFIGAGKDEIVFCSGGTEGDNLAIRGAAHAMRARGRDRVISSPLEHPAVAASLGQLAAEGFRVEQIPVDGEGAIDPRDLEKMLGPDLALVTLATANHEIGNLFAVGELAELAHRAGALFHTDAVQAAGRVPFDVAELGVDLATISSHKLHGPKGAGAIFSRRGLDLPPLVVGGHQERERRPGTENVPGIVGFGVACRLARAASPSVSAEIARLRDRLERAAMAIDGARRFGGGARVPGTLNVGFHGVEGELLMESLDLAGIAVSTGAACSSGSLEPSPVILALGVAREVARSATRFSLGRDNTEAEIDRVAALLPSLVARIRATNG
jgi:cysteine desulfurase